MLKSAKRLWKNEFFQGGVWFTASGMLINFLNYGFNFIAARKLGPSDYSEIIALFSYLSIISVPTGVLSTFIIQKITTKGEDRFKYARSLELLFWQKVRKWWIIGAIILLFSPIVPTITNLSVVSGNILLPIIFLTFIGAFYSATLQGLRLFALVSVFGIFGTVIKLSGAIGAVVFSKGLHLVLFFIFLSSLIPIIVVLLYVKRVITDKIASPARAVEKRIISLARNRQFLLILFSAFGLTLINNLDVVFVKKFLSSADAGLYGSWSLFAKIILYAVGPVISISFIFFSSEKNKHDVPFRLSLFCLMLVGVVSFLFYTFFASFIIDLFFGERFNGVAPYLSQASIFGSLYTGISFINSYFLAKQYWEAAILPIMIPLYAVLLFFIPRAIGAVITLDIFFVSLVMLVHLAAYLRRSS